MTEKDRLDRLDDDFVEAVLAMSSEEAMEGISADEIKAMRSRVSAAAGKLGRQRLANARAAMASEKGRPRPASNVQGAKALDEIRANDAAFNQKLTLAARNGGEGYEEDRASIEADLEELRQDEERGGRD